MSRSPIPVFWYENPAHYEEFQKILSDAYVLPFDYHDWRIRTDSMVERYENSGIQAVKVVASTYDLSPGARPMDVISVPKAAMITRSPNRASKSCATESLIGETSKK